MKNSAYFVLAGLLCLLSCSGSDDPEVDPCTSNAPQISNAAVTNASCGQQNGSLTLTGSGGEAPYQFSVNGNSFQESNTFNNLAAGNYNITLKDANGCTATLAQSISDANNLQLSAQLATQAGCGTSQGAINLTASGGAGSYTYSMDGTNYKEEAQFANLAAGEYTLSVKDEANCTSTTTVKVMSGISFQNHVKTIVDTNCAVSGCHVAGTGRQNFTNFATIKSSAANMKTRTQNGSMPPPGSGKTLTEAEKQAIACWVDDGAVNN